MDCAACAKTVEKAVAALDGVRAARVSFGNATLAVEGDVGADAGAGRGGARRLPGAAAEPATRRAADAVLAPRRSQRVDASPRSVLLAVAVAATLAGAPRAVAEPLYLTSMAVGGWPIARAALAGLRRRSLDMNVLMTLAAVGAVGIGAYAEGAWVLVLFAVGTTLESFAFDRSRRSVAELMDLAPEQARVIADDGGEQLVDVEDGRGRRRFVVRPGERIPLDGVVVAGASSVDEAPITGESVPVDKQPGDELSSPAPSTPRARSTVRTRSPAAESTLSRVAALVEEAQGIARPSERFIDRFARIYTPLVFAAALAARRGPAGARRRARTRGCTARSRC